MKGKKRKGDDLLPPQPPKSAKAAASAKQTVADVFSALKRHRAEAAVAKPPALPEPSAVSGKPPKGRQGINKKGRAAAKQTAGDDPFSDSRGLKGGRKTVDGLPVYTPEELGLHTGGGNTPLCPFDCECCV
eukprot:EG_transcript_28203